MMKLRSLAGVALLTILVSACAEPNPATPLTSAAAGYRLYVLNPQNLGQFDLIDAATGRLERRLPLGTPSPDWSSLYTMAGESGRTVLRSVDPRTGDTTHQISFDGAFHLPAANYQGAPGGISQNGRWLVAESAVEKNRTSFIRVNTSFIERPKRITLEGSFSFDAISNDGNRLYLVESLASTLPGHYRVRLYDIANGSFDPRTVIDKREAETAAMTGTRLAGVFAPDGGWLYSLYRNEHEGAFIHALKLDENFAWCIDLPALAGTPAQQLMWSLAVKADGSSVYAVNPALGKVAAIDLGRDGPPGDVSRVSEFKLPNRPSSQTGFLIDAAAKQVPLGSAALSEDERTLFATAANGLVAIDVASLKLKRQLLADTILESVVLSQDGRWLFASSWSGPNVFQIDPGTGTSKKLLATRTPWTLYWAEAR